MAPIAPEGSTTGRKWDFPAFVNFTYTPRGEQGENYITFDTLRSLADPTCGGLDTLRLAIETRKDQMSGQRWQVKGRAEGNDGGAKARKFEEWMRRPDGIHTFQQWMRMIMEDHFVIDAPALYFSVLRGRPLFEPMDGATLKLLITAKDGRTPLPPFPAYQQIIKGMPSQNYTIGEIGYYPYNLRTNRIYGMSRVEQVLVTVMTSINRAMSQLSYFTEGTVPDGFMEVPKTWSLEEISRFTDWFNSEMSGQLGERRKMRFVPEGAKYVPTKDAILKDVFDEWLVRIICYCFSLSPQAFVKEMNRATSDTAKETSLEEGLEPVKLWFKDAMDDVLDRCELGDLEWQWQDEEIVDPEVKARVFMGYYGGTTGGAKPVLTLDEVRKAAGFKAATPEQRKELQPPEPEPTAPDGPAGSSGNGTSPNGKSPNGKPKTSAPAVEKIAAPVSSRFGYSRVDGMYADDRLDRARLTASVDRVAEKVASIDGMRETLSRMHTTVASLVTASRVETPAPVINVHPAPAPDVNVEVNIPTPDRGTKKITGTRKPDGTIELTTSSEDSNGKQ
jgi:hypothetical protein